MAWCLSENHPPLHFFHLLYPFFSLQYSYISLKSECFPSGNFWETGWNKLLSFTEHILLHRWTHVKCYFKWDYKATFERHFGNLLSVGIDLLIQQLFSNYFSCFAEYHYIFACCLWWVCCKVLNSLVSKEAKINECNLCQSMPAVSLVCCVIFSATLSALVSCLKQISTK